MGPGAHLSSALSYAIRGSGPCPIGPADPAPGWQTGFLPWLWSCLVPMGLPSSHWTRPDLWVGFPAWPQTRLIPWSCRVVRMGAGPGRGQPCSPRSGAVRGSRQVGSLPSAEPQHLCMCASLHVCAPLHVCAQACTSTCCAAAAGSSAAVPPGAEGPAPHPAEPWEGACRCLLWASRLAQCRG